MTEEERENISYHYCPCPKCKASSTLVSYDEGIVNGISVLYNESYKCPTHGVWLYKWDDASQSMIPSFISRPVSSPPLK